MVNGIVAMPPKVVKLRFGDPSGADAAMANAAVMVVPVASTMTLLAVTPVGAFKIVPVRLLPVIVTARLLFPCAPVAGVIEVTPGEAEMIENDSALLVPAGVV